MQHYKIELRWPSFFFQPFVGSVIVARLIKDFSHKLYLLLSVNNKPATPHFAVLFAEEPSVSSLAETFVSSIKLRSLSRFGGGIILHGSGILCRRTSVAFLSHLESCLPVLTGRGGGCFKPEHIMSPFTISERWNEMKQKKQNLAKIL